MPLPGFTKTVVGELENDLGEGAMNTLLALGDLNRDGLTDIVVSGRNGRMAWFENPGRPGPWARHWVAEVQDQECGGLTYDLTGSGYPDILNGGDWRSNTLSWWENPGPGGGPWTRRTIATAPGNQFHDEAIGDVTGDGRQSLVFWNQGSASLFWVPLPEDPRVSPWPDVRRIASERREGRQPEEGLALADLDGDGVLEVVAGTSWYKHRGGARGWESHRFARGYITTVIAVGDLDGDGRPEVVLSEGDACIYGKPEGGKLAWFKPGSRMEDLWEEHVLAEGLLDPHSLQLGDLCGSGRLDILVGEIGVKDAYTEKPPRLMVYENQGRGGFTRHIIDEGTGCHHARLADLRNRGVLDIVSRPLHGPERWSVVVWYNNAA